MLNSVLSYEKICPDDILKERIVVRFSHMHSNIYVNEAYCVNPACSCTEVILTLIELPDDDHQMNELFTIKLDMARWEVTDKKILNKKLAVDVMLKEFMYLLDELKEKLLTHAIQAKEYGRKYYLDYLPDHVVKMLLDGVVVAYSEVFGSVDTDILSFERIEGEKWFIEDQYCSNPKCQCNDAVLSFYKYDTSVKTQKPEFDIRLNLKNFRFDIEYSSCDKEIISAIMKFVHSSKPELFTVVKRRYQDIKKAGKEMEKKFKSENMQETQKIVKIGRNDPCPCGSGMKYKKCCGR